MKRILFFLLMLVTCFNLAGGYAIAASVIAQHGTGNLPSLPNNAGQHHLKKSTVDLQVVQVKKDDSENDELFFPLLLDSDRNQGYSYIPDFKLLNKHFLLHYGTSIKDKELSAYILHQNFRL